MIGCLQTFECTVRAGRAHAVLYSWPITIGVILSIQPAFQKASFGLDEAGCRTPKRQMRNSISRHIAHNLWAWELQTIRCFINILTWPQIYVIFSKHPGASSLWKERILYGVFVWFLDCVQSLVRRGWLRRHDGQKTTSQHNNELYEDEVGNGLKWTIFVAGPTILSLWWTERWCCICVICWGLLFRRWR